MIVASIQNFRSPENGRNRRKCVWPSATAAYAFTIVTLEQINRNVLNAVTGTFSTLAGGAHAPGALKRRMMEGPISAVKHATSEPRKPHTPALSSWTPD